MAIKVKLQGPRFKEFENLTKMAKVPKPQGPKWQFTLIIFMGFLRTFVTDSITFFKNIEIWDPTHFIWVRP
ncbi:hypothetical protein Hanom_Chr11g01010811 [Helianthus anomalus]